MKRTWNVMGLFDGMSCGQIALGRAGIEVGTYYASEVDKYAIAVSKANYPNTQHMGDITKWRDWDIDWGSIDLLIGGPPCQDVSLAGKGVGIEKGVTRSGLLYEYVELRDHILSLNPNLKFLVENVKMKKDFMDKYSDIIGVKPLFINSALVSAQNRQRYYWCNWDITAPDDKGIVLSDILEPNLPSCGIGARVVGRRLNSEGKREDYNKDIPIKQYTEVRADEKSNCLTTVGKDSLVAYTPLQVRDKSKCVGSGGRGLPLGDKHERDSPFKYVSKKGGGTPSDTDLIPDGYRTRRFTVLECERLQTVPCGYTDHVSTSQRYKMLGNGWTVDVVAHLFTSLPRH